MLHRHLRLKLQPTLLPWAAALLEQVACADGVAASPNAAQNGPPMPHLSEAEDVVHEQQHILALLVTEVLGNGQTSQCHTGTSTCTQATAAEDQPVSSRAAAAHALAAASSAYWLRSADCSHACTLPANQRLAAQAACWAHMLTPRAVLIKPHTQQSPEAVAGRPHQGARSSGRTPASPWSLPAAPQA